jgi:hypothetical protein
MRTVLTATVVLQVILVAPDAHASSSAVCPAVQAFIRYDAPLTSSATTTGFTMNLQLQCAGSAPAAGLYFLALSGTTSSEDCVNGWASAPISGREGEDPVTGTGSYIKGGLHYYGIAPAAPNTFTVRGVTYTLEFDLQRGRLGGPPDTSCPYAFTDLTGTATLTQV